MRNDVNFIELTNIEASNLNLKDYNTMIKAQTYMKSVFFPTDEIMDCFFVYNKNEIIISRNNIYDNISEYYRLYYPEKVDLLKQWFDSVAKDKIPDKNFFLSSESTFNLNPDSIQNEDNQAITYTVGQPVREPVEGKIIYI